MLNLIGTWSVVVTMISEPYVLPSEGGGCRAGTRFASEVGVAAIFSSSAPGVRPRELSCGEDFVIAGWGSRAPREGSTSASRVSASPQRRTTSLSRYLGQADIFSDVLVRPPIKRGARPRLGFASVPAAAAFVLLEAGKVTVGWVRARVLPPKRKAVCFRCLNPGHLGARCPKFEGRVKGAQKRCFRCGAAVVHYTRRSFTPCSVRSTGVGRIGSGIAAASREGHPIPKSVSEQGGDGVQKRRGGGGLPFVGNSRARSPRDGETRPLSRAG